MTTTPEVQPSEPAKDTGPVLRALPTTADLEAVDIDAPVKTLTTVDPYRMYRSYEQAFSAAREANDEPAQVVYRLVAQLCSMGMSPADPANVWQPLFTLDNGVRGPIAEDFRGEATTIIAGMVGRVSVPVLKARLADIAWSNNRKDGASAAAAVDAYCDVVSGIVDGSLFDHSPQISMHHAVRSLQRAMQIANMTTKRGRRPPRIGVVFDALYQSARERKDVATFVKAVEFGLWFGLREPVTVAADLETTAGEAAVEAASGAHPLAIKGAYDLAANLYHNLKDDVARQRCLKAAVEHTLAMREQVRGSAAAEAGWITSALLQLRHVTGMEDRERDLEIELRRLQKDSLKQMGSFEIDLKLGGTPEKVAEHFDKLSLANALKHFAMLDRSRDPDQLRAAALESAKSAPLISMLSVNHLDDRGRPRVKSAGAPPSGEPDESWFRRTIGQSEGMHRARMIRACIEPARAVIHARFGIAEGHFTAIVGLSAFVPDAQKPIIALGFTRLFQGDLMSATHLLIPQMEPCLRHLLMSHGHDASKRRDDTTEEDLSLNNLFVRFRSELEAIMTRPLACEIDNLFNAKPGPALRHELAHGQISAAECFTDNVYYANWLIYRICCLPLIGAWGQFIAPQLATEE